MIEHKKKCVICGEEFNIRDLRNQEEEKTCGRRICMINSKYQKRHMDPRTGYKPSGNEIKQW